MTTLIRFTPVMMALKSVLMTTFIGYTCGEDDAEGAAQLQATRTPAERMEYSTYL